MSSLELYWTHSQGDSKMDTAIPGPESRCVMSSHKHSVSLFLELINMSIPESIIGNGIIYY
jgi:hypothetical protein